MQVIYFAADLLEEEHFFAFPMNLLTKKYSCCSLHDAILVSNIPDIFRHTNSESIRGLISKSIYGKLNMEMILFQ
jgi:hypothetical protein